MLRVRLGPLRRLSLTVLLLLAFGVGLVSLRYLSGDPAVVPPSMRASFTVNGWVFVVHAVASALALMLGAVQFLAGPRRRWPRLHRWMGRSYVLFCFAGVLSAFWIAPDVEGGGIATLGFSVLAAVWMGATTVAWRYAAKGRFDLHKRWMLRSYALTAAAITLRLQLLGFEAAGFDYDQVSAFLSFSCWLPNIVLIEMTLWWRQRHRAVSSTAPRRLSI